MSALARPVDFWSLQWLGQWRWRRTGAFRALVPESARTLAAPDKHQGDASDNKTDS